nr:MAG TPA: hypothetical protein [Caudoviricetes sp.]
MLFLSIFYLVFPEFIRLFNRYFYLRGPNFTNPCPNDSSNDLIVNILLFL